MTCWPESARIWLLLLMLAPAVLAGCTLSPRTTVPAEASLEEISPPFPFPSAPQMAGKSTVIWRAGIVRDDDRRISFLIRKDEAREELMQAGLSPFWVWRPLEPGQYQVRVRVGDGSGPNLESGWSEPFQVVAPRIAVLPFVNLSTAAAPLDEMRRTLTALLKQEGVDLLEENELLSFMGRHRLRSTATLSSEAARAFLEEAGVTGVLITQLTLHQTESPPKFALISRLVTTGAEPGVGWAGSLALTGDSSRGLLDLGLIRDIDRLRGKGLARLAASLGSHLDGREGAEYRSLRPRSFYRSPTLDPALPLTVAILPFVNQSQHRFAGELMGLHFLRHLSAEKNFRLLEPGLLEEQLLRYRIVAPEGASLDTANLLFGFLDVDLLLSGKVLEYEDTAGEDGSARVQFSVQVIHRRGEEVVWSSISSNKGGENIRLFDLGKITTAHELASRMAKETVRQMAKP